MAKQVIDLTDIYKPHPRQVLFHQAKERQKLFGGAIRGGKTKALVAESIQLCIDYPGNVGLICRQTLPAFKRTVLVELEKYFDAGVRTSEGLKKLVTQHHSTDHFIQFFNGSRIWYTGLGDDTQGLTSQMGITLGFVSCDQVEEISEIHFNNLIGRLSLPLKDIKYYVLMTANPLPGWVKNRFISSTPKDFIYIPSLPRDNPYLPANYEEELREQFPDELARAWLDGDWNVMEAGNYVFSWNEINRAVDLDIKPEGEKWLGIDVSWGGTDENVAIVRQGGKVLSLNRWIYRKEDAINSVDKIITIINENQILHKNVNIDAVSGGSLIYSELIKRGYLVRPVIAGEKPDDETKYINKRAEMYYQLQKRFRDNSISIPDDKTLIAQLTTQKYLIAGEKKLQLESKEKMDKSPDRADALALAFYEPILRTPQIRWL
ncbi:MAG: phage terminase large subunit [Candidatus Omnitrophica bacterium]|nr:phage terminase large subunit [Candidatus Omnitrophota bacterium]